ncbi:hypothetical protein EH68_02335 [Enterococcus gallinarum]|nr:hypothetical protein [Enterococcus gallinarum]KIL82491.1 hypothetical protein EH68_02335 [Enterococcus gallinarum]
MLKQQVLKPENIKSIELSTNGKDECYTNPIVINGLKAGKGIKAVKLDLVADKVPKVIIIGTPRLIQDEVKKAWGLDDSEWEEDKHGKVVIDVEMLE